MCHHTWDLGYHVSGLGISWFRTSYRNESLAGYRESNYVAEANGSSPGYALHLKGVQAFLFGLIGKDLDFEEELIQTIVAKQEDNPFFNYVLAGPEDEVLQDVLDLCPRKRQIVSFGGLGKGIQQNRPGSIAWAGNVYLWQTFFLTA